VIEVSISGSTTAALIKQRPLYRITLKNRRPTMVITCNEVYQNARKRRAKHPLKSGRYKLEETLLDLNRLEVTLALKGRSPDSYNGLERGLPQPVCIPNEFRSWGRKLPHILADDLGYYLLPAVERLVGDGIPTAEVHNILSRIEPEVTKSLETADTIMSDIQGRPLKNRQVDALYRLVVDVLRLFTAVLFSADKQASLSTPTQQ
jgi:hypothetical protein